MGFSLESQNVGSLYQTHKTYTLPILAEAFINIKKLTGFSKYYI